MTIYNTLCANCGSKINRYERIRKRIYYNREDLYAVIANLRNMNKYSVKAIRNMKADISFKIKDKAADTIKYTKKTKSIKTSLDKKQVAIGVWYSVEKCKCGKAYHLLEYCKEQDLESMYYTYNELYIKSFHYRKDTRIFYSKHRNSL